MKRWKAMALAWAIGVGWLVAPSARAANPAVLNIDVAIVGNLSVSVNGYGSSTQTASWTANAANQKFANNASSVTVINDSGSQTETWSLSTRSNSIDVGDHGSPGTWSRAASTTSVGADEFAVQAVFGSSHTIVAGCPAGNAGSWDASYAIPLTASPVTYTSSVFSDTTLGNNGTSDPDNAGSGQMLAASQRALCWRVITPQSTSSLNTQNIQVIVTAGP